MPTRPSVLVDSNLLLLLVVGLWNQKAITDQKRLNGMTAADFRLLQRFLASFPTICTTPHVLTEVSNLAGSATGQTRHAIFHQLAILLTILDERIMPSQELSRRAEFRSFGLTDAALASLNSEMLLLTEDGRLASHLQRQGWIALSLRDLRQLPSKQVF